MKLPTSAVLAVGLTFLAVATMAQGAEGTEYAKHFSALSRPVGRGSGSHAARSIRVPPASRVHDLCGTDVAHRNHQLPVLRRPEGFRTAGATLFG